MATGGAFFNDPKTINAVADLANADRLTIVAGAGLPIESGLPSWGRLVYDLLLRSGEHLLAGHVKAHPELAEAFARWTVENDGLLAGAAVARATGQDERAIRQVLYSQTGPNPHPGPSARALAELRLGTSGVTLGTQNYDDTLGLALEERLEELGQVEPVERIVTGGTSRASTVGVTHLHGLLTATKQEGVVVLTEGDYFDMASGAWQADWMQDRLAAGACLFVGSSMTDPNLLRYLHQASSRHATIRHVAVLPRQSDAWLQRKGADPLVREARDAGALARWERLGLTALQPDYFSDSAQFLYEVLHRRRSDGVDPYADRIRKWQRDIDEDLLRRRDTRYFGSQQDWLQSELQTYCVQVKDRLSSAALIRDERLQISLWVRQPGDTLLLLAASDRAHRDPQTLEPVAISGPSEWISVQAYRQGSTLLGDTSANMTSRWNTVMGIPVSIRSPDYGRLQVGVVTLAGSSPLQESALAATNAGPGALADIRSALESQAAALLTPPTV